MNPKKISFSFLCLTLILTFASLSFSEEQTKEAQCHTTPDKVPSLKDNCACNALLDTLNLLGIKTTPDELSTLLPLDKDGLTSMYDLLKASQRKGLKPKALKLTYEELLKVKMPVIVHLNTNHFITLKGIKEDGIILIENNKETFILKDEFLENYSGYTLTFNLNTKGLVLSNKTLKQIKGAHCTCGACSASDCSTGSCGGAKSCSSANCQGTCPEGGSCNWCPNKGSAQCGGSGVVCSCGCGFPQCIGTKYCPSASVHPNCNNPSGCECYDEGYNCQPQGYLCLLPGGDCHYGSCNNNCNLPTFDCATSLSGCAKFNCICMSQWQCHCPGW